MDVILYRRDRRGRLRYRNESFRDARELREFFASREGSRWRWAEANISADPSRPQFVHHEADELRARVIASSRTQGVN